MQVKEYQLIIFDWDGTLMDSVMKIVTCVQAVANQLDLPVPSECQIRRVIGYSLEEALRRVFPQLKNGELGSLIQAYRHQYIELDQTPSPLFEGTESLLQQLSAKGYQLAVATGKGRNGLDRLLQQTGLGHFFSVTRCADETQSKPHPMMLEQILTHSGKTASQALMIGDSLMDLKMAQNAGMDSVGVSYGAFPADELVSAGPQVIIDYPCGLIDFLNGVNC